MTTLSEQKQQELTSQYANSAQDQVQFELDDGRFVIGQYVDTDNHTHFIVRNPDQSAEIVDNEDAKVVDVLLKPIVTTVVVPTLPQP